MFVREDINRLTGVFNKPFSEQVLVDIIEDKSIYIELKNMNVDIDLNSCTRFVKTLQCTETKVEGKELQGRLARHALFVPSKK